MRKRSGLNVCNFPKVDGSAQNAAHDNSGMSYIHEISWQSLCGSRAETV